MPQTAAIGIVRDRQLLAEKRFAPERFRLPCEEGTLSVGEANAFAAQFIFQQAILRLKKFNDNELITMNPA